MRRAAELPRVAVSLLALVLGLSVPNPVFADTDIKSESSSEASPEPVEPEEEPKGGCWWEPIKGTNADKNYLISLLASTDGGLLDLYSVHYENGQLQYTNTVTGVSQGLFRYSCWGNREDDPMAGVEQYREVGPPNPVVLLPALYDRVVRTIKAPVSAVNPSADQFINLGLWLAVEPPEEHPVVARAQVPGAWAEVRATVIETAFEMANGDRVVCTDAHGGLFGTPISEGEMDSNDEGPCGYTFEYVSDLGEQVITISMTWEVVDTTSTGFYNRRPDIVETTTVPIHVYEIQTVGGP